MTRRRLKLLGGILACLALIALAAVLLSQTRLTVQGSTVDDGSITLDTALPNAKCKKVLQTDFPFVTFACEQKSEALENHF